MGTIYDMLESIISSAPLLIIAAILGLDSIRAVLAAIGIFDPDTKWGRIIYGKRDPKIIQSVLKELGYSAETTDEIILKLKDIPKSAFMINSGIDPVDADIQLIILLSKYMFKFNTIISYGGQSLAKSNYYIDTMEISHNDEDKQKLAAIMICLLLAENDRKGTPKTVITPKGGNPLFVQAVASGLGAHLIIAKSLTDKSRINITGKTDYPYEKFLVNYEGSWSLSQLPKEKKSFLTKHLQKFSCCNQDTKKNDCIIMDCNTSGGSQLLDIAKDVRDFTSKNKDFAGIAAPSDVYILFRADTEGENIEKKFSSHQCTLHRFFDLDEKAKERMYDLKNNRKERGRIPSYYCSDDIKEAQNIIDYLKSQNLYHYTKKPSIII